MTDSKKRHRRSDFDRLVHDIVRDFRDGTQKFDNYQPRRLELVDPNGTTGLEGVDQQLLATFEQLDPKKYKIADDVHRRLKGWARVQLSRTKVMAESTQ